MALTDSVDYLQRCMPLAEDLSGGQTAGAAATRRGLRVRGVGRTDTEVVRRPLPPDERWRPHTAGLITGLYGYRIPLGETARRAPWWGASCTAVATPAPTTASRCRR
jgi:hypothetical protein